MEDALQQFYANGLAASTQKSYSSGQKQYLSFCNKFNLLAIPPSEHTLLLFISQLGVDGLSLATIKSYLSSVRNLLINAGITAPIIYTPRVELVIRGIKRSKVGFGVPNQCRLPITPDILLKLKGVWSLSPLTADKMMLWAAVCFGFLGFLRCAEFTVPSLDTYDVNRHLSFQDIGLCHPPNVMSIRYPFVSNAPKQRITPALNTIDNKLFQLCTLIMTSYNSHTFDRFGVPYSTVILPTSKAFLKLLFASKFFRDNAL